MANETQRDYILGVDQVELQRLRDQHQVWIEQLYALVRRAGVRAGDVVLDLGCGPGTTTFELAHFVGPTGRVIACDASEKFIEVLAQEATRRGLDFIEPRTARVESLGLEAQSLDAVYGRWILSWLRDVECVFEQVAKALRPGGVYVLQEYLDWGAMKLLPRSANFDGAVLACMQSWQRGGGTINVAELVPAMAEKVGLEVECFEINARSGKVGSPVWSWLGDFYESYLTRLVQQGSFQQSDFDEFRAEWKRCTQQGASLIVAPVVADILLRKPRVN